MLNKYEYDFLINEEINNVINSIMISEEPNSLRIINYDSNFLTESVQPEGDYFYIKNDLYQRSKKYNWGMFPNNRLSFDTKEFKNLMIFKGLSSLFVYYLYDDNTFGFEGARPQKDETGAYYTNDIAIARAVPYHIGSESWYDSKHFFYILFDGDILSLQNSSNPEKYSSGSPRSGSNFLKCALRISNHATKHQIYANNNNNENINCVLNIMLHSDGAPENRDANKKEIPFSPAGSGKYLVSIEAFYDIAAEVSELFGEEVGDYENLCGILCKEDKPKHAQINNLKKFQNIKNFVTDLRKGCQPTITMDWIKENIDPNPSIIVSTNDKLRAVIQSGVDTRSWKTDLYGTGHTFTDGQLQLQRTSYRDTILKIGNVKLGFPHTAFDLSKNINISKVLLYNSQFPPIYADTIPSSSITTPSSSEQDYTIDIEKLQISDFPISGDSCINFQSGETTLQFDLSTLVVSVLNKKNKKTKSFKGFLPEKVNIKGQNIYVICDKNLENLGALGYYKSIPFFCTMEGECFRITSRNAISNAAKAYLASQQEINITSDDIEKTPTNTTNNTSDGIESTPTNTMSENRINKIITESINKFIMKFCLLK